MCERAIAVFDHMMTYVFNANKLPTTYTAKAVKEAVNDILAPAKIAFFSSVASILDPFL